MVPSLLVTNERMLFTRGVPQGRENSTLVFGKLDLTLLQQLPGCCPPGHLMPYCIRPIKWALQYGYLIRLLKHSSGTLLFKSSIHYLHILDTTGYRQSQYIYLIVCEGTSSQ
jgi:hypothetical protein